MNFFKNLQTDFGLNPEGQKDAEGTDAASFFANSTNLFGSVKSKTENLVNDLSTKVDIGTRIDSIKRRASLDQFGQTVKDLVEGGIGDEANNSEEETKIEPDPKRFPLGEDDEGRDHENPFNTGKEPSRENSVTKRPSRPPPPRSCSVDSTGSGMPIIPPSFQPRSNSIDMTNSKRKAPPPPPPVAIAFPEKIEEKCEEDEDDRNSGNSSASEYGGSDGDQPIYVAKKTDDEIAEELGQKLVEGILTDEPNAEDIADFLSRYVPAVINGDDEYVSEHHDEFKKHMKTSIARTLFAKNVENEANMHGGHLGKIGLNQLLDHFRDVLGECQKSEDFAPAKKLLTTSLVYFFDDPEVLDQENRIFLFTYIKTDTIWHTLKFWNACFFQSIQEIRSKIMEENKSPDEIDKAVAKQLRSYLNTMHVFSLHTNIRLEFLRKQSELFNLNQEEMLQLKEMILEKGDQ